MIGIGCIAPIQTSNRFQVSAASERGSIGERVREVTEWSLPRVGPFFAGRDHTTVLHSVRRMEDRAVRDLELLAYMASLKQVRPVRVALRRP
jgi:Bacterial dnaA protein helix-turn-helix